MSAGAGGRPSPSAPRCSASPCVDVGAAEADAERAGEGGLAAARRSGWGARRRRGARVRRASPPAAADGRRQGRGEQRGQPGRDQFATSSSRAAAQPNLA